MKKTLTEREQKAYALGQVELALQHSQQELNRAQAVHQDLLNKQATLGNELGLVDSPPPEEDAKDAESEDTGTVACKPED